MATMSTSIPVEERFPSVRQLIEVGKEKGYLLYDEIYDLLPDEVASLPDELDDIYVRFGELGIEIIDRPDRYRNRDDLDASTALEKREGGEMAEFVVPEQEKTNDPVRMYLREMGTVPLLDREGEVEIAQRLEQGEWMIYEALCENPVVLRELLRLSELAQKDESVLQQLTADTEGDEPLDAKASDRIKTNLKIFGRIEKNNAAIEKLCKRQNRLKKGGDKYQETEREIDRLVAKIAKDIRSIDFSVRTRNQLGDFLKNLNKQFVRLERDIRRAKLALDRGVGGALTAPSAYFMKHPPEQFCDDEAWALTEDFIAGRQ